MTEDAAQTGLRNESVPAVGRTIGIAIAAMILIAAVLMVLQPVSSPDVWHHIKAGWLVEQKGGPARADVFSCTAQGKRWIQYEWLAQFGIYRIHDLGGVTGLMIFKVVGAAVAAMFLMLAARAWGAGWMETAVAVMLALCAASARFFARPEIFTFVIFAAWVLVTAKIRQGRHNLFFVPALLIVPWVNMHGAWIAGLAFLGLICGGETLAFWCKLKQALPKRTILFLWLALGLAFLLTLANPFGVFIWEVPFKLAVSPEVKAKILEWRAPGIKDWLDPRHAGAWIFLLALVMAPRKVRIGDGLVVLVFGVMALTARRHLSLTMLLTAPIFARQLGLVWGRPVLQKRLRSKALPSLLRLAAATIICAMVVFVALGGFQLPRAGVGLNTRYSPLGAARFLEKHELDGNLFNSYEIGNYLLFKRYPKNRVFIDGRVDMYGSGVIDLYDRVRQAKEGWRKLLAHYDIEVAVFGTTRNTDEKLMAAMHRSLDWALVYWDDTSAVYVQSTGAKKDFLARAYQYAVTPVNISYDLLSSSSGLKRAERDYRHKLEEGRDCVLALRGLAECLRMRGQFQRAADLLRKVVDLGPAYAAAKYNLAACLIQTGDLDEAERLLQQVLRSGMHQAEACRALGAIHNRRNNPRLALRYIKQSLRHEPGSWRSYLNLSILYEKTGDIPNAVAACKQAARLAPDEPDVRTRLDYLNGKLRTRQ